MSITIESWIRVGAGASVGYEVRMPDEEVDVFIGPQSGRVSAVQLIVDDPTTCLRVARTLTDAARELNRAMFAAQHPALVASDHAFGELASAVMDAEPSGMVR